MIVLDIQPFFQGLAQLRDIVVLFSHNIGGNDGKCPRHNDDDYSRLIFNPDLI